ncbi:MAG: SdrD B-like domain-containing protein, partial [Methanothrix sp.]|nr:SdrD B-like domain-containing protein [Methanothrix sp.]
FVGMPPNQKPAIINFGPDKLSPQEIGSAITWTVEFMDADDDPLQYQFALDGQVVQAWSDSPVWIWTASIEQVGAHVVTALVRDGKHNPEGDATASGNMEIVLPANNVPVLSSLLADKESPQVTGSVITWTASASDTENDPLQYQFALDGQVVQAWSDSPVWIWTASIEQIGEHVVAALVRDGKHNPEGDATASANMEIVLPPNNVPVLSSLLADKESPQVTGSAITWTASASDTENDPLQYQFALDGQVAADWSDSPVWIWTASIEQIGAHVVTAIVRDGKHNPKGDATASANFEIVLPPNNAPVLSSLLADKESPQVTGSVITWTASASDTENDPISYRFLINGTPATDWQPENLWTWTAMQPGTSQITAQVKDSQHDGPQGDAGNMSSEFSIISPAPVAEPVNTEVAAVVVEPAKQNESPALDGLTADSISPQLLGTSVTWTASASDTESDPISYRFLVNGTPAADWQSENQWTWTAMQPGTSQITVQVKDSLHDGPQGEAGNMSSDFSIIAPVSAPPAAENVTTPVAPENTTPQQTVNESEVVTIAPETVVPPAGENVTAPIAPENTTPQQPVEETKPSEPVIPAAVNQTPVLNSLTSDLTSPQIPGTTITWTANATDADQDPLFFRFFHSGPATGGSWQSVTQWSSASTWTQTTSSADAGENQVKAQVRDGKHAAEDGFDSELSAFITISEPARNISGRAYEDKNDNSLLDSGEALSGWTISLTGPDGEVSALTAEDGSYRFENLKAGSYTVSETLATGWKAITPESGSYSVDLSSGDAAEKNFANKLTSYSISGMKYNDLNGNGVNDGEPGMENWKITLSGTTKSNEAVQKELTTAADGSYRFEALLPGTYTITEVEQSGWVRTAPQEGSYSVVLADADVTGKDFGNHGSW